MRKFTTLILSLLMLAVAWPLGAMAQEEEEPVIYYDSKGYILDSPDHVRLDVPVIDRSMGARDVTCNIPEVRFTGLAQEVYPSTANTFVARVYSHGYEDKLCAVYYNTYYKQNENASETAVSSISTYGSIKFNIRLQGNDTQDVNITNGSGQVSFTYTLFSFLTYNVKALSLGIIDNYCIGRNRPLNFTYNLNQYGVYRMHYKIVNCTNSKSTIPGTSYTSNGAECCSASGTSHSDYYATSCTQGSILYETDMYMRVVSTKILAHPQGGEICPGGNKTLSVSAETCLSNGITYQWYKWNNGTAEPISGATSSSYSATEAGEYYCVTNDGRAPRETEHAVITITQMPEVTLAPDQYICPNSTLDLTMPAGAAYRWSDNSTNATLQVSTPGTYSVTMTSNGCSAAHSFNVQQLPEIDLIANTNETLCPGNQLTETLSVANATDIVWNNNAALNQSSLAITEAGTYTVSANVNGCAFTDEVTVVAPQYELIADETVQICEGDSYQVNLNANELSNIAWSGAASGNEATKTFTQPGTYNVSAQYQGCTFNDSFTLSYKQVPEVDVPANHILCANSTVSLTMPECDSYQWNSGSTAQTLPVTAPGNYSVTMTYNGCDFSRSFNVVAAPIYNIIADDAVTFCYGTTETLELAVNNASEIVWNNNAANNESTYVIAEGGTYTVSAKIGECTYTDQIVATQTENVNLIADETLNFCYGTTETLELAVANATDIVWNNDAANNGQTFVIDQSGTYPVVAKVDGCTYTDQIVATQSESVNLIADETVNFCYGTTETLELAVNNATEIVWSENPANNAVTYEISAPGVYTVSAKVDGCTFTDQIVATQSENVNLIADETVNFCYGTTETLELAVNNATEIVWSENPANNAATYEISASGVYTVSAKVDGCTFTDQITATQSENVNLITDETVNFCYGTTETLELAVNNATEIVWNGDAANNGQTFVINEGGTYNVSAKIDGCTYTDQIVANQTENVNLLQFDNIQFCYGNSVTLEVVAENAENIVWNNNPSLNETTFVISDLGTYTVEADVNGCHYTDQIVAIETQYFDLISEENVLICNGSTATISVPASAQNVVWDGNDELNGNSLEINTAGVHTVSADYNGCRYNDQIVATVAPELSVAISAESIGCNGGTTTAQAVVNGGLAPYAFAWSNSETSQNITVAAGDYSVVVTDANNCSVNATATISEPSALVVSINAGTIACNGGTTTAEAVVTGGTEPYEFAWSNGEMSQNIDAMAGSYIVTVTDANSCVANATATISEPSALVVSINAGAIACNGGTTTAEAVVTGGTEPYTFAWSNGEPSQNITAMSGSYIVNVTDGNECNANATVTIEEPAMLSVSITAGTIACNGGTTTAEAVVTGGAEPYTFAWSNGETSQNITAMSGSYIVTVTDGNECNANATVTITEPSALVVEATAGTIGCNGGTAIAEANVNGGVEPYSFAWSNSETSQTISAAAGTYSVTVEDGNGCSANASVVVVEPVALSVSINAGTIGCNGGTANIEAVVTGGAEPYAFAWSNGEMSQNIDAMAGSYIVTVTDANSCVANATATISEPSALVVSINAGTIACNGGTTTAEAVVTGGTEPYTFAWSSGETSQNINAMSGSYIVNVTDGNECNANAEVVLTEPAMLSVSITAGTIACNGGSTTAEAVVTGGAEPYTFAWSNGETSQNITAMSGSYILSVTDANSCVANATATITEPSALVVSINAGTIACNGGTATAEAVVTGGTEPYSFVWGGQETTQNIDNLAAGTYSVTVTDNNGCTASEVVAITEPTALTATIIAGTINCIGETTMAVANANGGAAPYSYAWSNQGTSQNISNVAAGDYSVTITDHNGCSASATATITEPEDVNLIAAETVDFCEGSAVTVTLVEGATNIVWDNDDAGASHEIFIAGTHSVSADVNGCHYNDQIVAVERPLPESGLDTEYSYVITNADTIVNISANAGYESYLWSNGDTESILSISCGSLSLPFDADYNLTITSEYGCLAVDTISVHIEMNPSSVSEFEVYEWTVVPNPSDGRFDIVGPDFDKAQMFDAEGRLIRTIEVENVDIPDLKPGMYYLRIYSGNITSVQKVIINK